MWSRLFSGPALLKLGVSEQMLRRWIEYGYARVENLPVGEVSYRVRCFDGRTEEVRSIENTVEFAARTGSTWPR